MSRVIDDLAEELNAVEETISEFSELSIDEAYLKVMVPKNDNVWLDCGSSAGYPMMIRG